MLQFTQGNTAQSLIVTLNEKKTLSAPYYLFHFKNSQTLDVVTTVIDSSDDLSLYPDRYNKFTINVSTLFLNKDTGDWQYNIYEQASDSNTDPDNATGLVETGKMKINPATEFAYTSYSQDQSFKAYRG